MLEKTAATDRDKAIIAGHYVFSKPEFIDLKSEVSALLNKKGIFLDEYLKENEP